MNDIHAFAKRYLEKGISVFPVNLSREENGKINKKPGVSWEKYTKKLPTEDDLDRWFKYGKYNGIGMATGKVSGLVAIDVENYATEDTLNRFESQMVSKTISGGFHFFYKWDEELRNTVKLFGEDVDFRGDGGYVVLPPSNFGTMNYSWHKTTKDFTQLKCVPDDVKSQLKAGTSNSSSNLPLKLTIPNEDDMPFPHITEGGRNDMASRVAGVLLSSIPRNLWNSAGWITLKEWNKGNVPPLSEQELRITFDSIKKKDLTQYQLEGLRENAKLYKIFSGYEAQSEYDKLEEAYGDGLPTGFKELDKYMKFLPEQLYLVSAATHVGKTTMVLNMCARIAKTGKKVLFVSLEQGIFVVPRVKTMLNGMFPRDLQIMTTDDMASPEGIIEIVENMKERPELIAIDHLHFFKRNGNGITQDIDETIIKIQNMAKKLKVPVIIIAHMRKLNDNKVPGMDDLRDSSSLSQVPAVVMLLWRDINDEDNIQNSYLSPFGSLFIAKNRVQGRTGVLPFKLKESGAFTFDWRNDNQQPGLMVNKFE